MNEGVGHWEVIYKKLFPNWFEKFISWIFPTTIEISIKGKIERIWKSGWFSSGYRLEKGD